MFLGKKIVSGVWLHLKRWFEKYLKVFSCILKNSLEKTFSHIQ